MQDVWNTTPAWRFPFSSSPLAPTPEAAALIDGGLAQQVVGLGAYGFRNGLVYAELTGYRTLSVRTLTTLGQNSTGTSGSSGVTPYWRFAVQPTWGQHSLEVGTFGLTAAVFPQRITASGTDRLTDVGFDTQYQFVGDRDRISFSGELHRPGRVLQASHAQGLAANSHERLRSWRAKTSYFYDHTYGVNLAYFVTRGSSDAILLASAPITGSASGSPNSSGWVAELDYASFWPWLNVRFALQYTFYDKFNGGRENYDGFGRNASDNNKLFLLAWTAF